MARHYRFLGRKSRPYTSVGALMVTASTKKSSRRGWLFSCSKTAKRCGRYVTYILEKNNCRSGLRQLSSRNQLIKIISYTKPSLEYIGITGILLGAGENILELIQPCLFVLIYHILIILDDVDSGLVLQALRCRHIITDGTAMQLLGNQSLSFLAGIELLPPNA